ncbi:hypothetical protein B0G81_2391 [Paraburkholderia sp. BL6665CI2N2]|nr:hypothetical protein B0G81_2391 [Paraburkholderia sp. BL6665CI2N2]
MDIGVTKQILFVSRGKEDRATAYKRLDKPPPCRQSRDDMVKDSSLTTDPFKKRFGRPRGLEHWMYLHPVLSDSVLSVPPPQ